jgi:hypothetical protein
MKNGEKAAVLINIGDGKESCHNAIRTVLSHSAYFSEVHVVKFDWDSNIPLYVTWANDREALERAGINVVIHSIFDESRVNAPLLIELSPYADVKEGPLSQLINRIDAASVHHQSLQHFAVASRITVDKDTPFSWNYWMLGFLIAVTSVWDFWKSVWWRARHFRQDDVRAKLVFKTFRRSIVAPRHLTWWLWNSGTDTLIDGRGAARIALKQPQIYNYVLSKLREPSFSLWLVPFSIYYFLFAFPWWAYVLDGSALQQWFMSTRFHMFWSSGLGWVLWSTMWALHSLAIWAMSIRKAHHVPFQLVMCFAYPFYLTLYPFAWIFAKIN